MLIRKNKVERGEIKLLLISFILYQAQSLFPESYSGKYFLLIIFIISLKYLFKTLLQKRIPLNQKLIILFIVLNTVSFIYTGNLDSVVHVNMLKAILLTFICFFPAYYAGAHNILAEKDLIIFFGINLLISIFQYYLLQVQIMEEKNIVVNNIAYQFVLLLPYVFLIKKNFVSIPSLFVIFNYIIFSNKRGAFIVGVFILFSYIYFQYKYIVLNFSFFKKNMLLVLILLVVIFFLLTVANNDVLNDRIISLSDKQFSKRDSIYAAILENWWASPSVLNLLLGFGFVSSLAITGYFAHNDWLEILSSLGLIGVFIYWGIIVNTYKVKNEIAAKSITFLKYSFIIKIILISIILTSLFSMWYSSYTSYLNMILLGYLLGKINTCKK